MWWLPDTPLLVKEAFEEEEFHLQFREEHTDFVWGLSAPM